MGISSFLSLVWSSTVQKHCRSRNTEGLLQKSAHNRPFPHCTSLRMNNGTRARFGWTFSYICCIFVHPNLDSVPLFVGMRERSIPLLDHLISEIDTYFDPSNDAVMSSLLCILPALLVSREGNPVQAAFQYYADDLPSPQVFDVELFRWRRKWLNADQDHLPSSAAQALEECNHEFFPNVHKLLRILCTLLITSAECERSFRILRRLKPYLRATMTSERESGLALMNIHYGRQIGITATIDLFTRKHSRRLLLSDILAE